VKRNLAFSAVKWRGFERRLCTAFYIQLRTERGLFIVVDLPSLVQAKMFAMD
jgi:hypothetical protein